MNNTWGRGYRSQEHIKYQSTFIRKSTSVCGIPRGLAGSSGMLSPLMNYRDDECEQRHPYYCKRCCNITKCHEVLNRKYIVLRFVFIIRGTITRSVLIISISAHLKSIRRNVHVCYNGGSWKRIICIWNEIPQFY